MVNVISSCLGAGKKYLVRRRSTGLLLCAAAGLAACKPDTQGSYAIYNYSGKPVISANVLGSSGNHAVSRDRIADQKIGVFGSVGSFKKEGSITLEWIAGEGRATWYSVSLPVKVEQAGGKMVEIYMRPDHFICASLIADIRPGTDSEELARARQDRSKLSCAQAVALPPLRPGMASGLRRSTATYSRLRLEDGGTDKISYPILMHHSGQVALRYEKKYRQQDVPGYIDEFQALDLLGKNAGWLVTADLKDNRAGWFIVSGDSSAWKSRFVGEVRGAQRRLSDDRLYYDADVVVDTKTADVFMLPELRGIDYSVMGQSPDGRHLAIYWRRDNMVAHAPGLPAFNMGMIELETGKLLDVQIAHLPPLPEKQYAMVFYGAWYKQHCSWAPLLTCR
ncbi:hypothetical protein [Janthinobacterium psychrotolerans]|uniref:Uncharacterized protein n=1 Tax=Janthinobacterium psychrotolerans TaxID=1747903 RepID=A0A1A7C649_9BURK|nr:hypothetical protein [Janthinobacterium psychrotolerans]OBV39793.1 hypothetical protein ASR47_101215 [Janthinobacterium psychrotolerans]